jgi:uncharacterized DUF497 family protein
MHGLSLTDIEALFETEIQVFEDVGHSVTEKRLLAVGRNASGRAIFVGFTLRQRDGEVRIRPVTARYMRDKEFARYAKRDPEI